MCPNFFLGALLSFAYYFYFAGGQELTGNNEIVNLNDVEFKLFTRKNIESEPATLDPNVPGGLNEVITSLKIVIYITGFSRKNESATDVHLRKAYLIREDVNFIHVAWYKLTKPMWSQTINQSVHPVANHIAGFIHRLVSEYSGKLENIHMIGYGLGAQIAGITASYVPFGKVAQITALDPSKHFFLDADLNSRLDESDANFVQVIHTGGRAISFEGPMGHADFYPNGGQNPQPMCSPLKQDISFFIQPFLLLMCSHMMSMIYYIESIYNPKFFVAQECENWAAATAARCDNSSSTAIMGYGADPKTRGVYYINITDFQAFADSMNITTDENDDNDQSTDSPFKPQSESYKPYPDATPKKNYEVKKKHSYPKKFKKPADELDIVQVKNTTNFNEDTLTEEEGDRIAELQKAVYTIETVEEQEDPSGKDENPYDKSMSIADEHEKLKLPLNAVSISPVIQASSTSITPMIIAVMLCITLLIIL